MFSTIGKLASPVALAIVIASAVANSANAQSITPPIGGSTPPITVYTPPPVVQQTPPPVTQPTPPTPTNPTIPTFTQTTVPTDITRYQRIQAPITELPQQIDGFIFALATCQGVQDKQKGAMVFPVRGSLYSNDESGIKLARGRMLVIAADKTARIEANQLNVVIEPGSSAIVETGMNGITRVYSTAAYEKTKTAATVNYGNGQSVSLIPGQALIAADHNISEEELIPVDGIMHRPVEGKISALPTSMRLVEYSLQQMSNKNMLIACRPLDIHPSSKAGQLLKQAHDQALAAAADQKAFTQTAISVKENPITVSNLIKSPDSTVKSIVNENGRSIFARKNTIVSVNNDQIDLELGSILVCANKSMTVSTSGRTINISKGAMALVDFNGRSLKVINLSDRSNDSVKVANGSESLSITNSQEAVFTKNAPTLSDVFDNHQIGHRAIHSRDLGKDGWLTLSQISLADAMVHHPILTDLRHNSGLHNSKKLVDQVILAAAIRNTLGASAGAYEQGIPEDESGNGAVIAAKCNNCSL